MNTKEELVLRQKEAIEYKIKKFILDEKSEEFKKAQRIVNEHNKLLEDIKKLYKKLDIVRFKVEIDEKTFLFLFDIKKRQVVQEDILPQEIIDKYSLIAERWYKQIIEL